MHHYFVNGILYLSKQEILDVNEELLKGETRIIHKIERLASKQEKSEEEKKRLKRL
jgi:hypothetical protein